MTGCIFIGFCPSLIGRGSPGTRVAGMYVGGSDPSQAAFLIAFIPVLNTCFVIYAVYCFLKGKEL